MGGRYAFVPCLSNLAPWPDLTGPVADMNREAFAANMANARTTDIAAHVAKVCGLSNKDARAAVNATFEGVAWLLKKNERVVVSGIGAFSKTVKPAQKGGKKAKNPFTGAEYITKSKPASPKVKFRPGKGFKEMLGK